MGHHKPYPSISPWLSARADSREKRFIQVGNSLLFSDAFAALLPGARYLYFCMAMESGGRQEFRFPERTAKKYRIPSSSFRRYLTELAEHGFICIESRKNLRQDNHYRFSLAWKHTETPSMAISSKSIPDWEKETALTVSPSNPN